MDSGKPLEKSMAAADLYESDCRPESRYPEGSVKSAVPDHVRSELKKRAGARKPGKVGAIMRLLGLA